MGLALAKTENDFQPKSTISLATRKDIMSLEKEVQPLIWLLILKLTKSLKTVRISVTSPMSVMFEKEEWKNYVFRVWAHMKISLPEEFILQKKDIHNEHVDFLIRDWIFDINGEILTPQEWASADLIDGSLISDTSLRVKRIIVPNGIDDKARDGLLQDEDERISQLKKSFNHLVNTLLPPKEYWESKKLSTPTKYIKFPIFTVSKRN